MPPAGRDDRIGASAPPVAEAAQARSLEERLGAHWTVWIGGIALALGAVLLVRYSIERGFFGPGVRVALGMVLAVALVAAREFLRRRDTHGESPAAAAPPLAAPY